jgi:restriction system protein
MLGDLRGPAADDHECLQSVTYAAAYRVEDALEPDELLADADPSGIERRDGFPIFLTHHIDSDLIYEEATVAVPDFQSWFLPLLRRLADGEIHKMSDLYEDLADDMKLTAEERAEVLPSGKKFTYRNRIGWARTYLKKAGLVESPKRGYVRITAEGRRLVTSPPEQLNVKFLRAHYPEFKEFHSGSGSTNDGGQAQDGGDDDETPEESLARIHRGIRRQLTDELLDQIKASPPEFFERLVVDLLLRMGYGGSGDEAGQAVGKSGDGGIDGIINEDPLGLDTVCLQAKRWENSVGRPTVQAFAGSLEGYRAKKGVLITTSSFTKEAEQYSRQIEKKIVLIDGQRLASLMIQHELGVSTVDSYQLMRIDSDYFEDE